jgi:translation initiation factor 2 gamma subunit (eIF-2gamma)
MALGKTDVLSGCSVSIAGKLPEIAFTVKIKYTLFKEMLGTQQQVKVDPLKPSETVMLSTHSLLLVNLIF